MQRYSAIFLILLFFTACKKDLLHYKQVTQLDAHTTTDILNRFQFINDHIGFVVGGERFSNACILKTTDGGYTWNYNTFPAAGKELFTIVTSPNGSLYSLGFDGKLLRSNDTGNTWLFHQLNYLPYLDMAFIDTTHAMLVGGVSFNSGFRLLLDTKRLAESYDSLAYQLNKIKMTSAQTGYACGYGLVLKTDDVGKSWRFLQVSGDDFTGMDIHNGTELWLCGYNGSIFHSSDAGSNWERLRNGNDISLINYQLQDIVFKDSQNGWAVGEHGVVIHTTDGGHNWSQYDRFTGNGLKCITICANGDLLVAGYNGTLYRLNLP